MQAIRCKPSTRCTGRVLTERPRVARMQTPGASLKNSRTSMAWPSHTVCGVGHSATRTAPNDITRLSTIEPASGENRPVATAQRGGTGSRVEETRDRASSLSAEQIVTELGQASSG